MLHKIGVRIGVENAIFTIAAFAIAASAVLLYSHFYSTILFQFSPDAAHAISAGRNFLLGRGLVMPSPVGSQNDFVTIQLWPPGYPLIIVLFSYVTGSLASAGLVLSRLSLMLVAVASYWLMRPYCSPLRALLVSTLFFTPLGLMPDASLASSDAPFFLLSTISIAVLLRGIDTSEARLIWAAGAICGASVLVRNSGIALVIAEALFICAAGILSRSSQTEILCRSAYWGLGVGPFVCGLLLWNKIKFGSLSAYSLPKSTLSLTHNIGTAVGSYVYDSFPLYSIKQFFEWNITTGAVLALLFLIILAVWAITNYRKSEEVSRFILLVVIYAVVGTAMVVVARTRYQWGEEIGVRHVAMYDAFLIAAALLCLFAAKLRHTAIPAIIACAFVVSVVGLRAWFFVGEYKNFRSVPDHHSASLLLSNPPSRQYLLYYSHLAEVRALETQIAPGCFVATDIFTLLNSTLNLNAHELEGAAMIHLDRSYLEKVDRLAKMTPTLLVIGNPAITGTMRDAWLASIQKSLPSFKVLPTPTDSLIEIESSDGKCISLHG